MALTATGATTATATIMTTMNGVGTLLDLFDLMCVYTINTHARIHRTFIALRPASNRISAAYQFDAVITSCTHFGFAYYVLVYLLGAGFLFSLFLSSFLVLFVIVVHRRNASSACAMRDHQMVRSVVCCKGLVKSVCPFERAILFTHFVSSY